MSLLDTLRSRLPRAVREGEPLPQVQSEPSSNDFPESAGGLSIDSLASDTNEPNLESLQEEVRVLREQLWSGGISYDPDMNLSPQGGGSLYYNRLSQGTRELSPIQQERALELSYLLYESNPMAKSILETTRDFVLGNSVGAGSTDPTEARRKEQQAVIDDFWSDYVNLIDIKLQNKVLELGLFGEQCWTVEVNPVDGHVRLGYIDPAVIKQVLTDPRNVEKQIAVITYIRDEKKNSMEKWYKIISPSEKPNDKWYGRLQGVPTDNVGDPLPGANVVTWKDANGDTRWHTVEGACFFFTVNKVSNSTRGRSDLLSLIDWVDAYDQLLFGEVDRGLLLKAFIWDVTLQGYNDKQIDEYKKANPQPRPASVRYHNEKVDWEAVTPDLKAADSAAAADLILSYISTGARLPKTWLNGTMDVNRATAQELGAPSLARLALRQQLVKYMITYILTFVLDQAEMKGVIKKRVSRRYSPKPIPWALQVNLPDLKQVDQVVIAQALGNIVAAAEKAVALGLIDIDLAQEMTVLFIKQIGIEVNLTALRARLEVAAAENPPMPAGTTGGPGNLPVIVPRKGGSTFDTASRKARQA